MKRLFHLAMTGLLFCGAVIVTTVGCGSEAKPGATASGTACAIDSDCAQGQTCVQGLCSTKFAGGGLSDATGGADGGTSDAKDGAASGTDSGDSASGSDSGSGDSATGGDTTTGPVGAGACSPCASDSQCKATEACVPLLNNGPDKAKPNFCVKKCSASADCASGLFCEQATQVAQKYCIPPTFECAGCAVSGCASGQSCDYTVTTPVCISVGGACTKCQIPKDCGDGFTCVKQGKEKVCAPACGANTACAAGSACVAFTAGIQACTYLASTCDYQGAASAACKGCPDKCVAGACVECTLDSHCKGGTCVPGQFTCTSETCPPTKPHKLVTGICVACTNDTHCAGSDVGPKCIANACAPANQTNECSVCKAPYPGCVEISGSWSCVECATDNDCAATGKGTCGKTYTCSATTNGGGPTSGSCKSDSDCPAGTTGFDLACDVPTGLCYDKKGQCDNIAAFCNAAAGSVCKPFDGLGLGGGGLPQIPGLPGGGSGPATSGAGVCSCGASSGGSGSSGWDDSLCKQFSLVNCKCDVDSTSKDCDPIGLGSCCQQKGGGGGGGNPLSLIQCLVQAQGGGKADPACFAGASCLDMSCLTAAMGGGGGSSSGGGGYCSAGGGLPTP